MIENSERNAGLARVKIHQLGESAYQRFNSTKYSSSPDRDFYSLDEAVTDTLNGELESGRTIEGLFIELSADRHVLTGVYARNISERIIEVLRSPSTITVDLSKQVLVAITSGILYTYVDHRHPDIRIEEEKRAQKNYSAG